MRTMTSDQRLVQQRASVPLRHPSPVVGLDLAPLPGIPTPVARLDVVDRPGQVAKRVLDVTMSVAALIIFAPLMVILAIAVKRSGPGPVLFRQERIGQSGRPFHVLKFRSMCDGADIDLTKDAVAHRRYQENGFKLDAHDPRITRVGRVIRAASLDELPQLFNVLKGDMSLVGIRPLLAEELALRSDYDQACYLAMKPGMTGLWQVSGRSSVESRDRHALDRDYIESWSIGADLKLLLRTPIAVVRVGDSR